MNYMEDLKRKAQVVSRLDELIDQLSEALPVSKDRYIKRIHSQLEVLSATKEGLQYILERIPAMLKAGIFTGSKWEDPTKLFAPLVGGTLIAPPPASTMELLSELRMLAIATRQYHDSRIQPVEAREFLEQAIVHNLDIAFSSGSELQRNASKKQVAKAQLVFEFILDKLPNYKLLPALAEEVECMAYQRPVSTARIRRVLAIIETNITIEEGKPGARRLNYFVHSLKAPTALADAAGDIKTYEAELSKLNETASREECEKMGKRLQDTGLVSDYHAVLVQYIRAEFPKLLPQALGLNGNGKAYLKEHQQLVLELIDKAIFPQTAQAVYGLSRCLEQALFGRQPVVNGVKKIMDLDIHPEVAKNISKTHKNPGKIKPNNILLADVINVLGQPLGIGQGWNPTCQAARGISLWSQHAPGKLLNMIIDAARYNNLEFRFEGQLVASEGQLEGLVKKLDYELDAVSIVLVPHLDKIYNQMMRLAAGRPEDPHKWVNPALYGQWIPTGFISAYSPLHNAIYQYEHFVRLFYATHHPDYNGGHDLVYPNPVGLFITAPGGQFLGFHAISLLRIAQDPEDVWRIYFLNPNNEGRQKWDDDMESSVMDHGEGHGESSLPFYQLVSRIYAFHYNPSEAGNLDEVDDASVNKVIELAKDSWGQSYVWYA